MSGNPWSRCSTPVDLMAAIRSLSENIALAAARSFHRSALLPAPAQRALVCPQIHSYIDLNHKAFLPKVCTNAHGQPSLTIQPTASDLDPGRASQARGVRMVSRALKENTDYKANRGLRASVVNEALKVSRVFRER